MTQVSLRSASLEDIESLLAFWAVAGENDVRPVDSEHATRQLLQSDREAVTIAESGPPPRELVTLVVLDGSFIIEAGSAMGMNAGAARMRYSRARARLRKSLTS